MRPASDRRTRLPAGQNVEPGLRAAGSADRVSLYPWSHLSGGGQGCRSPLVGLQHPGDEPSPGRDLCRSDTGPPCRAAPRPGRLAYVATSQGSRQHHLMALPPRCPEPNPAENVWQFMRDIWLSNTILKSYEDTLDHCCFAWNKLIDRPWRIVSIGIRDWAHPARAVAVRAGDEQPVQCHHEHRPLHRKAEGPIVMLAGTLTLLFMQPHPATARARCRT